MKEEEKGIIYWLFTGCFLIFSMVVVGGITRLTQSGLSMVEWNLVMGSIPPLNAEDWILAFEKYQQFPEYKELNSHFTLEQFKSIFLWEYLHRLLGRIIGIVFIIPFIYFLVNKKLSKKRIIQCSFLFVMGAFQGFLGWFMVKSGLVDQPHVSHLRLAAHLITAFLTFSYTLWVALDILFEGLNGPNFPRLRKGAYVLFGLISLQIVYGAFVAGLKAGLYYNTFPKMGDEWFPESIMAMSPIWINFINGIAGVQFIHRYLAIIIVIAVVILWWKSLKMNLQQDQMVAVRSMFYIVLLQFLLGLFTLLNGVPLSLAVFHQAGALLLLGSNVFLMHRLQKREYLP